MCAKKVKSSYSANNIWIYYDKYLEEKRYFMSFYKFQHPFLPWILVEWLLKKIQFREIFQKCDILNAEKFL